MLWQCTVSNPEKNDPFVVKAWNDKPFCPKAIFSKGDKHGFSRSWSIWSQKFPTPNNFVLKKIQVKQEKCVAKEKKNVALAFKQQALQWKIASVRGRNPMA